MYMHQIQIEALHAIEESVEDHVSFCGVRGRYPILQGALLPWHMHATAFQSHASLGFQKKKDEREKKKKEVHILPFTCKKISPDGWTCMSR
jgi:hypothetical protein